MDNINLICKDFQGEIVNIFNNQTRIPFILKYYLIKQIWERIEQKKIENDCAITAFQSQEGKASTTETPLQKGILQNNNNEE